LFHNFKFNISNTTFRNISATSYILKTKKETAGDEIPKTKSKSKDESKSKDDLIQIISDDPIKLSDTNSKAGPVFRSLISTERNFITPERAMTEFCLSADDLKSVGKKVRRSPFVDEPIITLHWMRDVKRKSIEKWGSEENLEKERQKRLQDIDKHEQSMSHIKRLWREFQFTELPAITTLHKAEKKRKPKTLDATGRVIYWAIAINSFNFVIKFGAWCATGSHSLAAESIHSFADTMNQLVLAYGIRKSNKEPDVEHPYGYTHMRYVTSLLSGSMIFFWGGGLSMMGGVTALMYPTELEALPLPWVITVLMLSLVSDLVTLIMAMNAINKGSIKENMSFMEYVVKGENPSVNVVLMEDSAAVMGVAVALGCICLTSFLNSPIPDAVGSCVIGGILASVAVFIIQTNVKLLLGRSIPQRDLEHMNRIMEQDVMVHGVYDVKCVEIGNGEVRYKAEVDFDALNWARGYLNKQDEDLLLAKALELHTKEEMKAFLVHHIEQSAGGIGKEFARMETMLKKAHPEVRHCDLEIF